MGLEESRREAEKEGRDMLQMVKMIDHAKKYPHQPLVGNVNVSRYFQTLLQTDDLMHG